MIQKPGQSVWLGEVDYTQQHAYRTNLLAVWQLGEKLPWLLATNLPTLQRGAQSLPPAGVDR